MKRCLSVVLVLFLLVAGAGAYFVYRVFTPPQVAQSVPFAQLSPAEKQRRRADAKKVTDEIQSIARDVRSGEKKNFTVTITEEQLNTLLQDRLNTANFPVRDLQVGLQNHALALQGRVTYQGFDATGTLSGDVLAQKGELQFKADSLQVQGFSVGSMRDKAETQINKALSKWSQEMPGRIDSVQIADRQLTIQGTTKK